MKVIKAFFFTIVVLFTLAFLGLVLFVKDRDYKENLWEDDARKGFAELMKSYGLEEGDYMVTHFQVYPHNRNGFEVEFSVSGTEYQGEVDVLTYEEGCYIISNYYSGALKEAITDAVKKEIEKRGLFKRGEYTIDIYDYSPEEDLKMRKLASWITPETFDEVIYGEVRDYRRRDPELNVVITYYSKEDNLSKDKIGKLFTEAGWSSRFKSWRCDHYVATPETCTEADLRARVSYYREGKLADDGVTRIYDPIYEKFD